MGIWMSAVCGGTVAAVGTHGSVFAGMQLTALHPGTYQGFFEQALLVVWRLWSWVHGWEPLMDGRHLNHVEEYGRFVARAVLMSWPLLGFGVFWLISQCEMGGRWWRPLAIAIALPLGEVFHMMFRSAGLDEPRAEAVRSAVMVLLMVARRSGAPLEYNRLRPGAERGPDAVRNIGQEGSF